MASGMAWLAAAGNLITIIFSYLVLLPLFFLFRVFLVVLAPVLHMGWYIIAGILLPVKLLVKLETLYIYLGVAAVVGLVTGVVLHLSSTVLISLFNLNAPPPMELRSAASVRAAREQKKMEGAWKASPLESGSGKWESIKSTRRKQAEWHDLNRGRRREDKGLLAQTILEEDDDSEDGL